MKKKQLTITLASAVTLTAMTMAAASAWDRGAATLDRALLIIVGCIIAAAVHLLPALLSRRRAWLVWPVWMLCFLVAAYGHTWLFSSAADRAGEARAGASALTRAVAEKRTQIEAALSEIKARPVAIVAQLRARATMPERQQALDAELVESHRAARLHDELISLASASSVTAPADPVTVRVTAATGFTAEAVSLTVNSLMAILVEILGMLLWQEALARDNPEAQIQLVQSKTDDFTEVVPSPLQTELQRLRHAVEVGACSPKVKEIRQFLNCSQLRAMQLRRDLIADIAQS